MVTHTLKSIRQNKKVYNKIKKSLEKRLEELKKLQESFEHNLKLVKLQIYNNQMILKSRIPIETILGTKK